MPGHIEIFRIGILSWVTWLPAVGAILLLFFNRNQEQQHSLVREYVDRAVLPDFDPAGHRTWRPRPGLRSSLWRIAIHRRPRLDPADRRALSAWR